MPLIDALTKPMVSALAISVMGGGAVQSVVRRNLLTYTEDFSNAAWSKQNDITATADGTLTVTGATGRFNYINQDISLTQSTQYTFSVEAKAGTQDKLWMLGEDSSNCFAVFDLTSGTYDGSGSFPNAPDSGTITDLGDGWFRCSITFTKTSVTATEQIGFGVGDGTVPAPADGFINSRNPQLETGSTATAYQAVVDGSEFD